MKKHCKILATVGPASRSVERLEAMIRAGTNLFRLNFSHGDHDYHRESLENIRNAAERTGLFVGVLQDISGPKVRIGKLRRDVTLQVGDRIELSARRWWGISWSPITWW
jgi:pyruvate kinase